MEFPFYRVYGLVECFSVFVREHTVQILLVRDECGN